MAICINCGKKTVMRTWSRHQKGSSGHGGAWNLKAQITKKAQHPNLHKFKGKKYCTSCLRQAKAIFLSKQAAKPQSPAAPTPASSA